MNWRSFLILLFGVTLIGYMVFDLISRNIRNSEERDERHEHKVEVKDTLNYGNR